MSLTTPMDQHDTNKLPQLRTADQFQAWRVRVADKGWALTGQDVFLVQNAACVAAIKAANEEKDYDKRDKLGGQVLAHYHWRSSRRPACESRSCGPGADSNPPVRNQCGP